MIFEFRNIAWFIGLIVAQIFFIDYLDFGIYSSYFSPIIICFFILKMKLDTTVINLLIYAFFLGFITDIFRNTLGLNTSVLLIISFLKPTFLYSISSKEDIEKEWKSLQQNFKWECEMCGNKFFDKHNLKIHMRREHPEKGSKLIRYDTLQCGKCDRKFRYGVAFRRHKLIKHNENEEEMEKRSKIRGRCNAKTAER